MARSGCYEANPFSLVLFHEADCLCNITVIRDYNRAVVGIQPSIVQKMYGEIDIRPLFFRSDDIDQSPSIAGISKQRLNLMSQKMTEINFNFRAIVL